MTFPHPDGLAAAKAKQIPGCCIFCGEPVGGRRKLLCMSADCQRAYYRAWHRDNRVVWPCNYDNGYLPPKYRAYREAWLASLSRAA